MENKFKIFIGSFIILLVGLFTFLGINFVGSNYEGVIKATILFKDGNNVSIQDENNVIYTFEVDDMEASVGETVVLEYIGLLNKNNEIQDVKVKNYEEVMLVNGENSSSEIKDNGIFSDYYKMAYNKVKDMTLDEKIAQIMLVRYPDTNGISTLEKYQFGGYVFFEKDFVGKTKSDVKKMINDLQDVSKIPILTAVDEEGGKVVRISSNSNLNPYKFLSPSSLYQDGGFPKIREDTIKKSTLLNSLGINLNLAPVVDVSTDKNSYIYDRTIGLDSKGTANYAKTVIEASHGLGVSYTLKHFPGYGNNGDTHIGSVDDNRTYDEIINNDIFPFKEGIESGAEAVMVSHNIVLAIDSDNPASLSASVHNLLRNELGFTGIIISDDLAMGAVSNIRDSSVRAIRAGNDLIISTNYLNDMSAIKSAINNGEIALEYVEKLATRVVAWKYYKGLILNNQK